jgi:hypothetical protein
MPAVFAASVFDSRVAKNSWTTSAISRSLAQGMIRGIESAFKRESTLPDPRLG